MTLVQWELASNLLSTPWDWRERRVQSLTPVDVTHYEERTSLHFTVRGDHIQAAIRAAMPRVPDELQGELEVLSSAEWGGQEIVAPVPLAKLPKRVLLKLDIRNAGGESLPLQNRWKNSEFAVFQMTRYLYLAQSKLRERDSRVDFQLGTLELLLRALAFSIPSGVIDAHFKAAELDQENLPAAAATMRRYLDAHRIDVGDRAGDIRVLLDEGIRLSGLSPHFRVARPLRSPLFNPLLLAVDLDKLRRSLGHRAYSVSDLFDTSLQLLAIQEYMALVPDQPLVTSAAQTFASFAHSWIALAPIRIRVGEPTIVKLAWTMPTSASRRRLPGRSLTYQFNVVLGDAQATHIEITSPDRQTVRIKPKIDLMIGSYAKTREREVFQALFDFDYRQSPDLRAFYSTKSVKEIADFVELVESLRNKRGRPELDPGFHLVAYFKLKPHLLRQYLAALAVGAFAFGTALENLPLRGGRATVTAVVAFLAGVQAIRERAIAAELGRYMGWTLWVIVLLLFAVLLGGSFAADDSDRPSRSPLPASTPAAEGEVLRPRGGRATRGEARPPALRSIPGIRPCTPPPRRDPSLGATPPTRAGSCAGSAHP